MRGGLFGLNFKRDEGRAGRKPHLKKREKRNLEVLFWRH
jgi:hypothetical protein